MANIAKLTVTNSTPVPILATQWGNHFQVQEDVAIGTAWPSTDYLIWRPPLGTTGLSRRVLAGGVYDFFKGNTVPQVFGPGDTVGWIETITGTTTFVVDESGC